MNNKFKSGLLIIMLVGPLLFFGLFHLFGTNHYNIPKLYPLSVNEKGDTTYHQIPQFNFIDQNNNEITLNDFDGKLFVANFFFTNCPTTCPKMSKYMAYLQSSFKNHTDEVAFISHSIEPEKDSVKVLRDYADIHGATDNVWYLVTGDKSKIYNQANEGYKIITNDNDGFMHSEKFVLIDKNKNIRGYFDGTNEKEVEKLLSEIWILMYEQSK